MDSLELYSILASLARACFFKAFKAYRNEEATNDYVEDVRDSIAKEITSTVKKVLAERVAAALSKPTV
jgi:hypothetical protein